MCTGIGVASAVIAFLVNCDYNILLTWAFYYLFSSLRSELPWASCDNEWNTPNCTLGRLNRTASVMLGGELNETTAEYSVLGGTEPTGFVSDPVTEFWE